MASLPTPEERRALAELAGLDPVYLYQCMSGFRSMNPADAREAEAKTRGKLKRWQLVKNWHRIWPELRRHPEAPEVPAEEAS